MINIYIDESGTKTITDLEQPTFLFSAVCIKSNIVYDLETNMNDIINKNKQFIKTKIYFALHDNKYTKDRAQKIADLFEKISLKDFELHCSEIIRGDNEFIILKENDRVKIIKDVVNLVTSNDIKIITSLCTKEKFKNKQTSIKDIKKIEKNMHETIVNNLVDGICEYLEEEDEYACIIADEGNEIIQNILIPKLKSLRSERLNPEVLEMPSCKNVFIQLADICAYIHNIKKRVDILDNYKRKSLAKELYGLIESNSIILYEKEVEDDVTESEDNEVAITKSSDSKDEDNKVTNE